jgi:hypothetical protein
VQEVLRRFNRILKAGAAPEVLFLLTMGNSNMVFQYSPDKKPAMLIFTTPHAAVDYLRATGSQTKIGTIKLDALPHLAKGWMAAGCENFIINRCPLQNVTLTNTGLGVLTVATIAATAPFAQTNTCGTTLNPGSSCTISVTFTPNTTGTLTGSISATDNAPGSPQTLPLSGVGVSPAVAFSPATLTFLDQTIFTTSAAKNVTLTNTGLGILTFASMAATGPFAQTNTCSAALNPAASCTISVTFKPTAKGALTGSVAVTDNAAGSPQALPLTGTGTYMQFSPASRAFGTQPVGTKSLPEKIALTNKGGATVSIAKISIAGADAGDFAQTNTCGKTLASGASCIITVTFTPTAKGKRTAAIAVSDNGGGTPQTAGLSGTGT